MFDNIFFDRNQLQLFPLTVLVSVDQLYTNNSTCL